MREGLEIIGDEEISEKEEQNSEYVCPVCEQDILEKDLSFSDEHEPFHKECLRGD